MSYYGTQPILISEKWLSGVYNNMIMKPVEKSKIYTYCVSFYTDSIKPNLLAIIFLICISVFLYFRYKKNNGETFSSDVEGHFNDDLDMLDKQIHDQMKDLPENNVPIMNPSMPIAKQTLEPNYLPQNMYFNMGGEKLQKMTQPREHDDKYMNYLQGYYGHSDRDVQRGTYNQYDGAKDTSFQNHLGFSNAFNSTTGQFVDGNIAANNNALNGFSYIEDTTQKELIDAMNKGILYEPTITPPYA